MGMGIELIAAERKRQIVEEDWPIERNEDYTNEQLVWLACYYALPKPISVPNGHFILPERFFDIADWNYAWAKRDGKPRIQQLVVAAALLAAEIDRLIESTLGSMPKEVICKYLKNSLGTPEDKSNG
jgi:hypothetical protein